MEKMSEEREIRETVEEIIDLCRKGNMNEAAERVYKISLIYQSEPTEENYDRLKEIILDALLEREPPIISGKENCQKFHKLLRTILNT